MKTEKPGTTYFGSPGFEFNFSSELVNPVTPVHLRQCVDSGSGTGNLARRTRVLESACSLTGAIRVWLFATWKVALQGQRRRER